MNIRKLLNPSYNSSRLDVATFTKWEKREIDTQECIRQFIYNNNLRKRYEVSEFDEYEFGKYLQSLGYLRDLEDLEKGVYNK